MACSKVVSLCCGTSDPNELEPLALKQFPDELPRYRKFKFKPPIAPEAGPHTK